MVRSQEECEDILTKIADALPHYETVLPSSRYHHTLSRGQFLQTLAQRYGYQRYLEIGKCSTRGYRCKRHVVPTPDFWVFTRLLCHLVTRVGCSLDEVFAVMRAQLGPEHTVGVDPVSGGTLRLTSDDFFAQYQVIRHCTSIQWSPRSDTGH